jgi:putative tryptophan/tyrosine transport system substrate-binding protein
MVLRKRALVIPALLLFAHPASAREVLVVQSVRSSLYEEALQGFRSVCRADSSTLVLSDYADPQLARVIREERPRLVLAVGDGALTSVRKIRKEPVLALMALRMPNRESRGGNVTGIDLFVKPEQYLTLFKKIRARRVGVVYDPARTGWYVKLARAAAKQQGIELVLREVNDPRQSIAQLASLKGEVDSLWLLPDTTAVSRETLEAYFLFAQQQSVPIVSFTAAHLKLGAVLALEADRVELGKQGGELAQQLLHGAQPAELGVASPRKVSVRVNDAVARRLRYSAELIATLSKR